ncbi:MAG TPA: helix-turn-helix transcriptional regulator [Candidatus Saccharimonadales bacterium]|nr:helix-turn-helix transcriptional regulator [Candidatus Saccharimonadales bacterium]
MSNIEIVRGKHKWMMHEALCNNLNFLKKQQKNDWDFKVLVSGDGMTRTGKSTHAFQEALYLDEDFADNWKIQTVFDGAKLIETAYAIGKGKVIVYDEAREGLDSKKQMMMYTKNLLDFFSQCGNLNHIVIIVLPEFFELPKTVAITQSIFLVNCYAQDGFDRGYFDFFNRKDKKYLYINGQKYLDYKAQKPSFKGTFTDFIPFDREEYETLKNKSLIQIRKRESYGDMKESHDTELIRVRILIKYLRNELKIKALPIAERIGISVSTLYEKYITPMKQETLDIQEYDRLDDINNNLENLNKA